MTEYKKISFRQLKKPCSDNINYIGEVTKYCYPIKKKCTAKNCPIWKRLKSIQNEDAISFLTNEMHPDKPVTEGGR